MSADAPKTLLILASKRRLAETVSRVRISLARRARADLAHINRVSTLGELTASLAHEVNQPIAAAVTNANACLRWLTSDPPNLEEARASALSIVKVGMRASGMP
jgi:C4-dicarboxylate-specific signal transduction histidine kinase